jgi:hypothetical protein
VIGQRGERLLTEHQHTPLARFHQKFVDLINRLVESGYPFDWRDLNPAIQLKREYWQLHGELPQELRGMASS